jgi:ribosome-associated toxin RatA of RatAB toxin-antitoxin module
MAKAEVHEVLNVPFDKMWETIVRYENYPHFVEGCTGVKVERKGAGAARATYDLKMMKDVSYTLDHKEDKDKGVVEWNLVQSDMFKKNTGRWELKDLGGGRLDVRYDIEIEFKIPVPGFILNGLVKKSLPGMVKNFEKQANRA